MFNNYFCLFYFQKSEAYKIRLGFTFENYFLLTSFPSDQSPLAIRKSILQGAILPVGSLSNRAVFRKEIVVTQSEIPKKKRMKADLVFS